MSMLKNIIVICAFLFTSCGKSPLLKEKVGNIQKTESLETDRFFKTTNQQVKLLWLTSRSTTEEGKAIIILYKNGTPTILENYQLDAYLWMKSMGHGSSPIVVKNLGDGIYELSEIYFTMAGDWQLHLTLKNGNNQIEDIEYAYDLFE